MWLLSLGPPNRRSVVLLDVKLLIIKILVKQRYASFVSDSKRVDELVEQWRAQRPDLDLDAMATVARILRLAGELRRRLDALAARYDVLVSEADVLFTLRRAGDPYRLLPSELSESLLVSSGTLTNRLDRLEGKGLIERRPNPDDRRSVEVALTRRGLELTEEAVTEHVASERRMLAGISDRERQTLDRLTAKLLDHVAGEP
jgi:DNA-binding MarR family transcriptional regulator